jgi:hypothetical protein
VPLQTYIHTQTYIYIYIYKTPWSRVLPKANRSSTSQEIPTFYGTHIHGSDTILRLRFPNFVRGVLLQNFNKVVSDEHLIMGI